MNELFFHECRAAGLVFKTSEDWFKWLTENSYDIKKPVAYPSRYDTLSIFYGNEKEAEHDALTCIIRDLEKNAGTKNTNLLLWAAKKKRADIIHRQQELFK